MTAPYQISYFVRFGERRYLEDFILNGTVYMNNLEHFKTIEAHIERADINENITGYFQPKDVEVKIGNRVLKDFAGPITMYDPNKDKFYASHIFCMSHLPVAYTPRDDKKIFDERMANFESLILLKPNKFVMKMVKALDALKQDSKIYGYSYGLVKYLPKETYSGDMTPFTKTDDYAHQQEFRFVVSAVDRSNPLIINLGSLHDIALGIDMTKFENRVEIDAEGKVSLIFN